MKNIKETVEAIIKDTEARAKKVEDFAREQGFTYITVSTERNIIQEIRNEFPELTIGNNDIRLVNGIDSTVGTIDRAVKMVYPNGLNSIGFNSINEKKKTVKLNKIDSYNQYYFEKYFFGIEGNETEYFSSKNLIKEYKNGSAIYQFNDKDFDMIKKVILFDTKQTKDIINNITPKDKLRYLEISKLSYGNPYNVILDIRQRLNINNFEPVNHYKVFQALNM